MKLHTNGVIKRLYRQEISVGKFHGDQTFQQLDFQSVTPLLLVLGAGIILSIFVFVIEVTVHYSVSEAHKNINHRNGRRKLMKSAEVRSVLKCSAMRVTKKRNARTKVNKMALKANSKFQKLL